MRPDVAIRNASGKKIATYRHRTVSDLIAAMQASLAHSEKSGAPRLSSVREDRKFAGTSTIQEYIDMLANGWPEGIQDAEGLEGLSTDASDDNVFVRDVGGAFPIVPAALAGVPDNMLNLRPMPTDRTRGVTLVIDACFSAWVKPDTVLTYAKSVMRLVAWLAAEKVEVNVFAAVAIQHASKKIIYGVPIRESGDILAPERVAAVLHPSFLRRAWFALVEREYYDQGIKASRVCRSGFGHVLTATLEEMQQVLPNAYSVIMLPKVGRGDPTLAVKEAITLKLRRG